MTSSYQIWHCAAIFGQPDFLVGASSVHQHLYLLGQRLLSAVIEAILGSKSGLPPGRAI